MNRRDALFGLIALGAPFPSSGQQRAAKIPRIGFVLSAGSASASSNLPDEVGRGFRDLGLVEGRDYQVEILNAEGILDRIPGLVDKLVQQKVDVIVLTNNVAIVAAKKATQTIPIVMVTTIDPVSAGYVASLARPGANITGLATLTRDLSGKRIELVKEMLPGMDRLAILWHAGAPGPAIAFKNYEAASRNFKLRLQSLQIHGPEPDLAGAFAAAKRERADGLIVVRNPLVDQHRVRIMDLAKTHRLPAMCESSLDVSAGGLMSYAANSLEMYRGIARFVDRILKGARPGDLPIEQPTTFELVVNQKTARAIGLVVPQSLLLRADKVIQ